MQINHKKSRPARLVLEQSRISPTQGADDAIDCNSIVSQSLVFCNS
nr:MAG TPA: hypothetical protein [Caudoviricetes sp.]DAZ35178.1 MAG TPA: hypothetical protein [Caudoviricetes sp.]